MAPPVHTILGLTPELFERDAGVARRAAVTIDALLRGAPIALVAALDHGFRDAGLHRRLGLNFIGLEPVQVARLKHLGPLQGTGLMIASLVRSGHVRELAVRGLCDSHDPLALAFLINRLNDYVGDITRLAWAGIERRMTPGHANLLVHCLPLLERTRLWVRAAPVRHKQLRDLLLRPHPACRQALWDAVRGQRMAPAHLTIGSSGWTEAVRAGPAEGVLVLQAAMLLAELHRGEAKMQEVLTAALVARDTRTRRWGARIAIDPGWTPREVLFALAPLLQRDRAPAIRAIGLQARALQGDRAGVELGCFDVHASVRFRARAVLADMFTPLDYRGLALATLAAAPEREAAIAALGVLADLGRAEDAAVVAGYADDPRGKVAREARRTRVMLGKIAG